MPRSLDLLEQAVLALGGALLCLLTLGGQVRLELLGVPVVVWCSNVVLPVLVDQIDQVLAISWGRVWDVVVRQPSLKLGLMPLVVSWKGCVSSLFSSRVNWI